MNNTSGTAGYGFDFNTITASTNTLILDGTYISPGGLLATQEAPPPKLQSPLKWLADEVEAVCSLGRAA